MLTQEQKFKSLSPEKQDEFLIRVLKVYTAHRHPERSAKLREEYRKIYSELGIKESKHGS